MRIRSLPLLATGLVLTACSHEPLPVCEAEPAHFCEIFLDLNQTLSAAQRAELRAMAPEDVWDLHFDLGMYVRNAYGLWEDNAATAYFHSIGIEHPDSMSGPVIAGYSAYLRGDRVDMQAITKAAYARFTDLPDLSSLPHPQAPDQPERQATPSA